MEFCKICEIFPGFTPSLVADLTMSQFFLYAGYANQQKRIQLNLENVNDYLNAAFGKKSSKKAKSGTYAEIVECKTDFNTKVNNIGNLKIAKESLMKRTGRTKFDFGEIIKEIARLDTNKSLNYKIV